ncbi:hypothetical protein TSOC_010711 [Tetrabaena socialis]|uniref:Uncharacterized protein n=1 Tax=Tetrabaena socialis TaxID=47790 RepID=A0A2J7ZSK3_9CHLO|nr:hypothetical protein TSOC_010711 [Tetrabaena socialis]|eukprot:PNH03244.1 hypothetical protein TSOC_010711 [Tetrabaena socialis]
MSPPPPPAAAAATGPSAAHSGTSSPSAPTTGPGAAAAAALPGSGAHPVAAARLSGRSSSADSTAARKCISSSYVTPSRPLASAVLVLQHLRGRERRAEGPSTSWCVRLGRGGSSPASVSVTSTPNSAQQLLEA